MKQVVIEADDFGLTLGISRVILAQLQAGVVTAANAMPTVPGFIQAVQAAEAAGQTTMGIHFIMDRHLPASAPDQISSLVDASGHLLPWATFTARLAIGEINFAEVELELTNQLALATRFGLTIDHITTHKNFDALSSALFDVVSGIAATTGLPLRNTIGTATAAVRLNMTTMAQARHLVMPDASVALNHTPADGQHLQQAVQAMSDDSSLVVVAHPGVSDDLLARRSSLTTDRESDRAALVRWQGWIQAQADVKLVTYRQLG